MSASNALASVLSRDMDESRMAASGPRVGSWPTRSEQQVSTTAVEKSAKLGASDE